MLWWKQQSNVHMFSVFCNLGVADMDDKCSTNAHDVSLTYHATCTHQNILSTGCLLHHQECLALVAQPVKVIGLRYAAQASLVHSMHQV